MRIRTTYIPATDTQGARIRATVADNYSGRDREQLTRPYDHASNDPHRDVAAELAGRPVWQSSERHPSRGYFFLTDD